jgi:hypothetical protein
MNTDKEIGNFLREERSIFKKRNQEVSPSLNKGKEKKRREAINTEAEQKQLKEK